MVQFSRVSYVVLRSRQIKKNTEFHLNLTVYKQKGDVILKKDKSIIFL